MQELMEALQKAALENIVALLNDPDPVIRLETSIAILRMNAEGYDGYAETLNEIDHPLTEEEVRRLAEAMDAEADAVEAAQPGDVLEAIGVEQLSEMSEEELAEEAERQAAAAQALRESEPHSGRSSLGAGQVRR